MFDRLFGRDASREPKAAVPSVRNMTIGRSVVLDPLAWRRFGDDTRFQLDRDTLNITAQGLIALDDGAFVHRFYTDDHVLLQAVSDDREGVSANDFTLFIPWSSDYPGDGEARRRWADRLRARRFTGEALPDYDRLWFGGEAVDQAPVTFWEEVFDDRAATTPYARIFQTCMLFARDLPQDGRELLLAVTVEPERGDLTQDIMIGLPLSVGEFSA